MFDFKFSKAHEDSFTPCTPVLYSSDVNNFICKCNFAHISIFHVNIRSLRSNFDEFLNFMTNLNCIFDLIVLSEIWTKDLETELFCIDGYTQIFNCRETNKSGGIVIYVSQKLSDFVNIPMKMISAECVSVYFKYFDLQIISIYRSHQFKPEDYLSELENHLKSFKTKNLILVGDININILENSTVSNLYLDTLSTFGLRPGIFGVTRESNDSSSCIDHIFYRNCCNMSVNSAIIKYPITDHFPLISIMCFKNKPSLQCQTESKKTCIDLEVFKDIVNASNPGCIISPLSDCDKVFKEYLNKVSKIINSSKFCKRNINPKTFKKPWMTCGLLNLIKEKEKLYNLYRKNKYRQDIKSRYLTFRNSVGTKLRCAKSDYYHSKFLQTGKNIREQWKIVKSVLNENPNSNQLPNCDNKEVLAYDFNKHFSEVFKSSDAIINFSKIKLPSLQNSMFFEEISEDEISNIILSLKNKKSTGIDEINKDILKILFKRNSNFLTTLINLSFEKGIFFSDLKTSVVVPVFKKGSVNDLGNYRPISLLSVFSKVIEKLMKSRLLNFLEKNKILSANQYGFQKEKSTEHALMQVTKIIYSNENKKLKTAAIFLDICKAFDTVNHELLLHKLNLVGIRGNVHAWFKSYLKNRNQLVKIENIYSKKLPIEGGVPQGSVLGPVLFLIFINDLCNLDLNCKIVTFADDTALIFSDTNYPALYNKMEKELTKVNEWFKLNLLNLNVSKTKFMIFNLKPNDSVSNTLKIHDVLCNCRCISCSCAEIERVETINYLGLKIDDNFKWKSHVNSLLNKLRFINIKFFKLKKIVDQKFLKTLYFSWIQSLLNYGITVYASDYISNINPLLRLQNKILSHFKISHQSFTFLNVRQLFVFRLLIFIFKNKSFYDFKEIKYSTRGTKGNLFVPKSSKEIFHKSHVFLGPYIFNKLNETTKLTHNFAEFKNNIYKFIEAQNTIEILFTIAK